MFEPIQERIAELKFSSADPLFRIHHPNLGEILVRALPYRVFLELTDLANRGILSSVDMENMIFQHYVLDKKIQAMYPDEILAGDVTVIAREILVISEPGSSQDTQFAINHFMGIFQDNVYEKIEQLICMAYPTYTPDFIIEMPWNRILYLVAKAQLLLLERGALKKPLEIFDKKKGPRNKRRHGAMGSQTPGEAPGARKESRLPPEEQERQHAALRQVQERKNSDTMNTVKRKRRS